MSRLSATFIVWLCFFINMGKSNLSSTNFHLLLTHHISQAQSHYLAGVPTRVADSLQAAQRALRVPGFLSFYEIRKIPVTSRTTNQNSLCSDS